MYRKVLNLIVAIAVFSLQFDQVVLAEEIIDEATQVLKNQNIDKPFVNKDKITDEALINVTLSDKKIKNLGFISDEIDQSSFKKEQLLKQKTVKNLTIEKEDIKVDSKYTRKYKLIDENQETVYVYVSSLNKIVTKKGLFEGQKVKFIVAEDVYKNKSLFIKKNTPVFAYIETITKSSFNGDPAQLIVGRFTTYDVLGNIIELSSQIKKNGANRSYWVRPLVTIGYCVPIFGTPLLLFFFVKGGRAKINTKQEFKLYYE
jgi:basic membrane lipoprotein Med (substrate-binding protein (PBP1-ABC) superfamily)